MRTTGTYDDRYPEHRIVPVAARTTALGDKTQVHYTQSRRDWLKRSDHRLPRVVPRRFARTCRVQLRSVKKKRSCFALGRFSPISRFPLTLRLPVSPTNTNLGERDSSKIGHDRSPMASNYPSSVLTNLVALRSFVQLEVLDVSRKVLGSRRLL